MRVLLTGGTGFIGSHLIDLLLSRGAEIFALIRNPEKASAWRGDQFRILPGDLFSIPPLPRDIDIVFHLAGITKSLRSKEYYTVNQGGTASLFRALLALEARPKVICLSSQAAGGPCLNGRAIRESDSPRPVTPYGRSKLQGEQEALEFKESFPLVIVRPCAIFGPGDRDFLEYFRLVKRGLIPVPRQRKLVSLCYVKDLVHALDLCAQTSVDSGEIFNIADPRPYAWEELGEAAAAALGRRIRRVKIPMSVIYGASLLSELKNRFTRNAGTFDRNKYRDLAQPAWVIDVEKASQMLSFRPRYTLNMAMQETIAWYVAQKWL
jgi:nucleoside-diphosphate-sugar epimerase